MDIKLKSNEQTTVTVNPENAVVGSPEWTVVSGTSATVTAETDGKSAVIAAVPDECGLTIIRLKAVCTNPDFVAAKLVAEKLEKETADLPKPKAAKTKAEIKEEKLKPWEVRAEKAEAKEAEAKEEVTPKVELPPETLIYTEEFFVQVTNVNPSSSLRIGIKEAVPIPVPVEPVVP